MLTCLFRTDRQISSERRNMQNEKGKDDRIGFSVNTSKARESLPPTKFYHCASNLIGSDAICRPVHKIRKHFFCRNSMISNFYWQDINLVTNNLIENATFLI